MTLLTVITTLPDATAAEALARTLIEERVAACVQIGAPVRSIYRWQGTVEDGSEVQLFIKTTQEAWERLQAVVVREHPYQVPQLVALPVSAALAPYAAWVAESVSCS